MTATLRQAANTVAGTMVEGASMAAALIGGAGGAYLGYQLAPASWPDGLRIAAAGAIAVLGAVAIDGLAEIVLAPIRRLMWKNSSTASTGRASAPAPAPAGTLGDALAQVATATEDDAAHRAAAAAFRIDEGANFLRDEDRWRGSEDGEASFYVAPGVWLPPPQRADSVRLWAPLHAAARRRRPAGDHHRRRPDPPPPRRPRRRPPGL
ncbi:hypothetical protein ACFT38_28070 [Streptomyces sp. NPDC056975]|uniref:hypothetical protein n=1 Tax=Streptomyces sp. NPDC056975 TaxID=3345985 RepID=UPI00363A009B